MDAIQRMLVEMEAFAEKSNIMFSTHDLPSKSKSKCIFVVGKKNNLLKPAPLMLCGRDLPFVGQADHLGHVLTKKGDMEQDAAVKRAVRVGYTSRGDQGYQDLLCIIIWLQSLGSWGRQG